MRFHRFFVLSALLVALAFGPAAAAAQAQTGYGDDVADARTLEVDPGDSAEQASDSDDGDSNAAAWMVAAGVVLLGAGGAAWALKTRGRGAA